MVSDQCLIRILSAWGVKDKEIRIFHGSRENDGKNIENNNLRIGLLDDGLVKEAEKGEQMV